MLPTPLTKKFTLLDELSLDESSGKPLDALESVFQCSRRFSGGFEAFTQELLQLTFWQSQDYPDNPYKDLCLELAAEIDRCYCAAGYIEPAYHSRKHFQDVCLALTALLAQPISKAMDPRSQNPWTVSKQEAWVLLFCALAHDFGHDGSINKTPFELEKRSIEKACSFLEKSWKGESQKNLLSAQIELIILATDPVFLSTLLAKCDNPFTFPTKTDCLCMLMVEADLLASTLPVSGKTLGKLLQQEWKSSNPKGAATVASDQGRLQFLQNIRFVSPYAIMLGIETIRNHSIELLKE